MAVVVPYPVEDFSTNTSNWGTGATSSLSVPGRTDYAGVNGDGDWYITFTKTFTTSSASTVFRNQDAFNSSGDAFFGNYITANVTGMSFYVKHTNPNPTTFYARIATAGNFPAMTVPVPAAVPTDVWTKVTIPLTFADYTAPGSDWTFETFEDPEPPAADNYNQIFSNVQNIQILAEPETAASTGSPKLFAYAIDKFTLVPEPASPGQPGAAVPFLTRRRRAQSK